MALAAAPALPGLDHFVDALRHDPRLVHVEALPARPARFGTLARPLPDDIADRFPDPFWLHQVEAIDAVRAGRSVVVATGTASGKSRCFQVPIAEATAASNPPATALLLYPTKALAQDQLRALGNLEVPRLVPATYDGDSTPEARVWARANATVLLTNPEMLHHGLLPTHQRWATFLSRLAHVVVDELHVLRGVFGTNVAHLLRRLRRICERYGSDPTFVFTSATVGEPGRLASELCGKPVLEVLDDASPRGERLFLLCNPAAEDADPRRPGAGVPIDDGDDPIDRTGLVEPVDDVTPPTTRRLSANRVSARLTAHLVRDGHRVITFCGSRRGTEVVAADASRQLPPHLAEAVRPYRAGYLAEERRAIEAELFSGRLLGVVATTALELGVDIGGLDACVMNGFPGTIASMWQQAGRAGRAADQSLAALVAGDDQLDQWFMAHPHELFTRPPEPAVVNLANPFVLAPHLACAAYEQPLTHDDERWWPGLLDDGVRDLVEADRLRVRRRRAPSGWRPMAVWSARGRPGEAVSLRGGGHDEVRIVLDDGTLVGTVDHGRACRTTHPGAIYLHRGQPYRVTDLDLDDGIAVVEPHPGGEYTQPRTDTTFGIVAVDDTSSVGAARLHRGRVRVRSQVMGYRRVDTMTGHTLGVEELDLPPSILDTRAVWYTVPEGILHDAGLTPDRWPGTLHAVEHAAIGILPLFTICDRWDVGGVSIACHPDTGLPTIAVYDAHPGGTGIAELAYAAADRHLRATAELIGTCSCSDGCPSCVQSPKCGNGNEPLDKDGAQRLLASVTAPAATRPAIVGQSSTRIVASADRPMSGRARPTSGTSVAAS